MNLLNDWNRLRIQQVLSYLNLIWFAPLIVFFLKFIYGYKIRNLKTFRLHVKYLKSRANGRPIVIAANHLTAIDSFIINWALHPWPRYIYQFKDFPWNVPEYSNFGHNPILKLLCYLGKCVYIKRTGSKKQKARTMKKLQHLAKMNNIVCIFPEGGRSRTGFVDKESATYGIGQILNHLEDPLVWC